MGDKWTSLTSFELKEDRKCQIQTDFEKYLSKEIETNLVPMLFYEQC